MKLVWQRQAETEFREAARYYIDHAGMSVAEDFRNAVMQAAARLLQFPELGMRIEHDTRRLPLHDYPYSLIYRVRPTAIVIVATANQRRRPGYWAGRR